MFSFERWLHIRIVLKMPYYPNIEKSISGCCNLRVAKPLVNHQGGVILKFIDVLSKSPIRKTMVRSDFIEVYFGLIVIMRRIT